MTAVHTTTTTQILIAEDRVDDQLMFASAAEELVDPPEITFADDGMALLATLWERHEAGCLPDLIVLDLDMPLVNGSQVLDTLGADPELSGIPVVVLSSSARAKDIERSYAQGVFGYETKPSSFPELVQVVEWLAAVARSSSGFDQG